MPTDVDPPEEETRDAQEGDPDRRRAHPQRAPRPWDPPRTDRMHVLHVSAPDAVKKQVPKRNRIAMGFAFGATILAVASLGVTQPDIGPYLEKARPYLQGTAATDSATVRPM